MRWAFNPIALAYLAVGGAHGGRPWPDSWAAVEDLFGTAYKSDARAVFYGSGGAPALIELLNLVADQIPKPIRLRTALAMPEVKTLAARLSNPDWLPRLLPFIVPLEDVGFTPPGAGVAMTETPNIGSYEQIGALQLGGVSWRDPQQGSTGDCYLIASMVALAWARPRTWRQVLAVATEQSKDKIRATFHGDDADAVDPLPFDVPTRVPLDSGHNWIYAHSSDHDETWPALVERAFVMLRHKLTAGEPTVDDYRAIGNDLFPHQAARILIGGSPFAHRTSEEVKPHEVLVNRCEESLPRSPTMAWTWPKDDPRGAGADWRSSTLVKGHAYAVLGLMAHENHNFVVLRNPYGVNDHVADSPGGNWDAGAPRNEGAAVPLDEGGVFAISEARFNECFQGVDGVDLPPDPPAP
jgi:hypothetical protein